MPRVRSQYIAEMRERFEVVDRVKASAEEKASLTKAIHEDEISTSPEVSPSKENTLKKDDVIRLSFKDDVKDHDDVRDDDNDLEQKEGIGEDEVEIVDEEDDDIESGLKVLFCHFSLVSSVKKYFNFIFIQYVHEIVDVRRIQYAIPISENASNVQ